MKSLVTSFLILSLADVSGENRLVFHGEFAKPLQNCRFYLYELSSEGDFAGALFRGKVLGDGAITLKSLPEHYQFGVVSEDEFRRWWSDDVSPSNHLQISGPEMWIYVPPVGHVEVKVRNPEAADGELRCAISGEGIGKSFPITFQRDGTFTITDRRPGNHRITITSDDGDTVYYQSETFEIKRMSKTTLPPVTLVKQAPEPASKETKGEDGTDQPATAPESTPEGNEKPTPESEGRSQ